MHIAVFTDSHVGRDETGALTTNDGFVRLIQRLDVRDLTITLLSRCSEVSAGSSAGGAVPLSETSDGFRYRAMPAFRNNEDFLRHRRSLIRSARPSMNEAIRSSDVVVVRMPLALGGAATAAAARVGTPIVAYWAGAPLAQTARRTYAGQSLARRLTAQTFAHSMDQLGRRVARRAAVNLLTDPTDSRFARLPTGRTITPSEVVADAIASAPSQRTPTEPLRVAFAGRLVPAKGVLDLVAALRLISKPSRIDVRIYGDGPLVDDVRSAAAHCAVPIRLAGSLSAERLLAELGTSHVLVLPSYGESVPKVLFEAWSVGLAPILTSVNAIPQYVQDGVTGLLHAPGDVPALARALDRLERDDALRRRLAQAGMRAVRQYTFDDWANIFVQACQAALAGQRRSAKALA